MVVFDIVVVYNSLVLLYFLSINSGYAWLLWLSAFEIFHYYNKPDIPSCSNEGCNIAPVVSLVVPAYNEAETLVSSIESLRNLDYPQLEIIVVNDGSNDNTLNNLKQHFKLVPIHREVENTIDTAPVKQVYQALMDERIIVVDKENGGKADALNTGLNYTRSDLFVGLDADSLIEKGALQKLVQPYLQKETHVVGVGGIVRVANNCQIEQSQIKQVRLPRALIPAFQVVEYTRAFLFGRAGWSRINGLPIISGAFGLFETDPVVKVRGYRTATVGEDMDLVLRLHRLMQDNDEDYELSFIPNPVCWTQVPTSGRVLGRQRNRWQRGLAESLVYNWRMIGNPKYGAVGLLGLPFFLLFELLGPVVEVTGYVVFGVSYALGWVNTSFALVFISIAVLYGVFLSVASLVLEEFTLHRYSRIQDKVKLLILALLENFGYRQLHALWRLKGLVDFFRSSKEWGEMKREAMETEK